MTAQSSSLRLFVRHAMIVGVLAPVPVLAAYAPLSVISGSGADDWLGSTVAGVGDINKDGYDDVIVGANFDDNNGTNSGSARVVSGANGATLYTFNGDAAHDFLGWSVSGAGDVNNDTWPDVIVGMHGDDNNGTSSGSARVYSGQNGAVLYTFSGSAYSEFGYAVAAAGDINGDGYDDVMVGAYRDDNASGVNTNDTGRVLIYSGQNGSVLYNLTGDSVGDWFGYAIDGNADVNNDGRPDIIVGAFNDDAVANSSGSAYVYSGANGSLLYTINGGNSNNDWFGAAVSMAGDINNDNYGDFIVGMHGEDTNGADSGAAIVYSGIDGSVLYTLSGDSAGDYFGRAVSGLGDVNHDGNDDFAIGAYSDDNHGTNSGSVTVYSGVNGSVLYTFNGTRAGDWLGYNVNEAGDVDGDGYVDIAAGAYLADTLADDGGSAYVFSGAANPALLDSDGDLVADSVDPFDANSAEWADTDSDGTGNNADTDDDGDLMPDAWERVYRFNTLVNDANGDADSDSTSNLLEYQSGTNPIDVSTVMADINDYDNDGVGDALLRSSSGGDWRLFLMTGGVTGFSTAYNNVLIGNASQVVATEDFDADGDTDVLLRNGTTGAWTMYETDGGLVIGTTSFGAYNNPSWSIVSIADYDANGIKDIVLHDSVGGGWRVFYVSNLAVSGSASLGLYASGWDLKYDGDIDGDGDADIILRRASDGYWRKFTIAGGVVANDAPVALYQSQNWQIQFISDLDADGDDDIVMRNVVSGFNWRTFAVSGGTVAGNTKLSMYENAGWTFNHLNDVDADGDEDIVLRSSTGGWRLFLTNGLDTTANSAFGLYATAAWVLADVVDVSGDGTKDVILNNTSTGAWRAFMIDGGVVSSDTNPGFYQNTNWKLQDK